MHRDQGGSGRREGDHASQRSAGHPPILVPGRDLGTPVDKDFDSFVVAVFDRQMQRGATQFVTKMNGPWKMVQNTADLLEVPTGSGGEDPTLV